MEEVVKRMEENIGLIIYIMIGFSLLLAIVEFFYELYKKKINKWRLGEMWASFSVYIVAQLMEKMSTLIFAGTLIFVGELIPWQIPVNGWTTVLCLILVDFIYYWEHVIEHKVRILWSYHSIHHSSPIYNYTTALRVSFIDSLITWIFYIPLVLIGFHPYIVLLCFFFVLMYQFWLHTEIIPKLGWFEKIFMTPSQHRVHHGSDKEYLDKNFGALLSVWDRLFGTFQEEKQTPTYGLTEPINTINPIKVHLHEYTGIFRDLRKAKNLKEAWNYLVKPPGWKPFQHEKENGETEQLKDKRLKLLGAALTMIAAGAQAQSSELLSGKWKANYELEGEKFSVEYEFGKMEGKLNCHTVSIEDENGNGEAHHSVAMKDIQFENGKGTALYILKDEGEVYETEATLELTDPNTLKVDYSYYGFFSDTEIWKRMN